MLLIYMCLLGFHFYKTHYKYRIDDKYALIDYYGEGFYLVNIVKDSGVQKLLVHPPIVWYCNTANYVIGCIGKDISNESESYKPKCKMDGYFILTKDDNKTVQNLTYQSIDNFLNSNKIKCQKINLYQ